MKVLILAPSFAPAVKAGGPARALTNLVEQVGNTHDITVVTADRDLGDAKPFPGLSGRRVRHGSATVFYVDLKSPRQQLSIVRLLSRGEFDIVVLNSLWNQHLSLWPAVLLILKVLKGKQVVLMPRGELELGALSLEARKKSVGLPIVRAIYASAADCAVATSESELLNIRRHLPGLPAYLTSDAVDVFDPSYAPRRSGPFRLLFVGRVHQTKGVLELLRGLAKAKGPIELSIVGPIGDHNYWNECKDVASRLPEGVAMVYRGVVNREGIEALYAHSDLMVTLTAGENFGHTIAESLQVGCPVLVTAETPWTDVVSRGGGSIVPDREDSQFVACVLDGWAALDDDELALRRVRAVAAFDGWAVGQPLNVIDLMAARASE